MYDTIDPEIAWAAGFFDGEGWSTARKQRSHLPRYFGVGVAQQGTPPLALLRFQDAIGCGNLQGPYRTKLGKDQYALEFYGKNAITCLETLWPYLCAPKKHQAIVALIRSGH